MPNIFHHLHRLIEMEESVGRLWHRLVTGAAERRYPQAAVRLEEMRGRVGILFRALGGDGGLKVETAMATEHGARRGFLQKLAGSGERVELAWRDAQALHLPAVIDLFPERERNADLYLWLAALAAAGPEPDDDWFTASQQRTRRVLDTWPGLAARYRRLVEAHLATRPDPASLTAEEAAREQAIRQALQSPGSVAQLPEAPTPPWPVPLWLHPSPPRPEPAPADLAEGTPPAPGGDVHDPEEQRRYQAEHTEMPDGRDGLVLDRFENILSWAEYVKVDRTTEEEEDMGEAEKAAQDLDKLHVARDSRSTASRIRFDLDLPSAESDDMPLGEGILLPEWDWRQATLRPDHCCLQPMIAADAEPAELPAHLRRTARRIRSQFEALVPSRIWHRAQPDGSEVDLEAFLAFTTERRLGHASAEQGLYRDFRGGLRDLSCLLLADLSLSTDAWIDNHSRIIDVIRDSLLLFAEALAATGDDFAMYGFSSRNRQHVRFHQLKTFDEPHGAPIRGRIQAIKPGFYTRMGAAIRQATKLLEKRPASQQLLLLLTDGKPNDLDQYEGRYGIEDTRMAVLEAKRKGLQPFCVTIDEKAGDYLPHMFGADGFVMIRRPAELPRELPMLYARLTA